MNLNTNVIYSITFTFLYDLEKEGKKKNNPENSGHTAHALLGPINERKHSM
jgi:hypothetical protein